MRLHSLFSFTAVSGVALAIGCSSSGSTVDGQIRDSDSESTRGSANGASGSDDGIGLAQAFTEVDNGFESDDPRGSAAADGMRGAPVPMMRSAANSASGANNVANSAADAAGDSWLDSAAAARAVEREVLPFVARGRITVPIAATYPLEQAAVAYDSFRGGGKLGKIVLLP